MADPDDATKELELETDWINGYQIKGGASYRVNREVDVFGNLGYVSKVPIFDAVISDYLGAKAEDPKNEKFTHIELGATYRTTDGRLVLKGGFYYTIWTDRTLSLGVTNEDGTEGLVFLTGMSQNHMGFELEGIYQPIDLLRLDLSGAIGNWKYTDDMEGKYRDFDNPTETPFFYPVKDLYVGDAPQMSGTLGLTLFPVQGLTFTVIGKYYANHYAAFDPFDRAADDPDDPDTYDRGQPWKIPSYFFADLHASYQLPIEWQGIGVSIFAHALNVFDTVYISDAVDNSSYNAFRDDDGNIVNPHKADAAEVFLGLPMSFNLGIQLTY